MSELRYPNESKAYREARAALLKDEQELIDKVKFVAEKRRQLPPGGQLKQDNVFQWASDGKVGKSVRFSELFGDKNSLLLYSWMFGPNWDKPCPSCTSLMDGFDWSGSRRMPRLPRSPRPRRNESMRGPRNGDGRRSLSCPDHSLLTRPTTNARERPKIMQLPVMHVFTKQGGKIFHIWGTETMMNHVDTVWPYWNLTDFTPEGRPDRDVAAKN